MTTGMVVLAGGIGKRIGRPFPKQFLLLGGKPLIIHVLEKARAIPDIERVVITCPEAHLEPTRELLANHRLGSKFECILGGASRQESVYNGLLALGGVDSVLIHEAVRPLVSDELVNVQLPQKFDRAKLLAAHEAARRDDAVFTEDAGLFFHYAGEPVRILPGSDENIKITVPTDTVTAEAIYSDQMGRGS